MATNRKAAPSGELYEKYSIPYESAKAMVADDFSLISCQGETGKVAAAMLVIKALKQLKWRDDHNARKVARDKRIMALLARPEIAALLDEEL